MPDEENEGFSRMRSRTLELRILAMGGVLLGCAIVEMALVSVVDRAMGAALWRGLGVEMFAGREAGMPIALEGGAPPWLVAQLSATQDVGVVCLAYPAFLWALQRFRHRDGWLMRRLRRLQRQALAHKRFAKRWGPLGVFAFMLVPFLVNGPLAGAVAGRVAGIRTKQLMLPVIAATCVAAVIWAFFYDSLFAAISGFDRRIAPILTIAIVAAILTWSMVSEILENRRAVEPQS